MGIWHHNPVDIPFYCSRIEKISTIVLTFCVFHTYIKNNEKKEDSLEILR